MKVAPDYYQTQGLTYHNFAIRGAKTDDVAKEVQYQLDFNRKVRGNQWFLHGSIDFKACNM